MTDRIDKELFVGGLLAGVFLVIGAFMIYGGYWFYNDVQKIRSIGIKTEGILVRYERRGSSIMKDTFLVPIIQFQTLDGRTVTVEGKVNDTKVLQNICDEGDEVEIVYDPTDPEHAVINTFAQLWFLPLLLWVIGIGFVTVPPFTIWRYYKSRKQ